MGQTADVTLKALATMDAQDYDNLHEWIAEDIKMWQGGAEINGLGEVIEMLRGFYGALPDLEHRILEVVEEGDKAAVQMNVVATHDGDFESPLGKFPATGKQTSWFSSTFSTVRDGKVTKLTTYLDVLAVHVELGYEPAVREDQPAVTAAATPTAAHAS